MLERAVRGALMNSLSFMWGFYFLLSAAPSLVATRAVVSALPQLIATSYFSRHGCSLCSGRWREPYRSGMWSSVRRLLWRGKQALEATFSYGGQFFEQSLALVNLFAFLDLDPATVPGSLQRQRYPGVRSG